jgi:Protein of unknown function (DUF3443)
MPALSIMNVKNCVLAAGLFIAALSPCIASAALGEPEVSVQATTVFNGQSLTQSFLDTGSNGLYFEDASLPSCTSTNFAEFYCPSTTQNLSATLEGLNGGSTGASFSVANAESLGADDSSLVAFATLAGSSSIDTSFDWGLPFYFGRTVYTVVENATTSVGTGPYVAF